MNKILVIEDEYLIRENILEILNMEHFQAIGAPNGQIGVQIATEENPDLILCDVMMPELDGYGVLMTLKENPATAGIPFIFLTAKADRLDVRTGMEMGADDYLTKPCTPLELVRAIETRLQKQSAIEKRYINRVQQESLKLNDPLHIDSLTQLPNRLSLQESFAAALKKWQMEAELNQEKLSPINSQAMRLVPVLCVGLDRFNRINDSLGYEVGDLLLKTVANRLSASVPEEATVARLNADQFAIVLPPVEAKKAASNAAQNLQEKLSEPLLVEDREVFITASIGIAFYPRDAQDIDKLLQYAKKGMDSAKQQGGNSWEFFTPAFNIGSGSDRLALETDLRYALEREELQIHYQPQVGLDTGEIVGCEALLRWYNPERGPVIPGKFIPLAEESGLIEPIGEWVLNQACRQMQVWHNMGFKDLRVAVNLSGRQFTQLNLRQRIVEILVETNLNPKYLELELTESSLVQNAEVAVRRLNALKAIGVQIAIDDFGTGYSSLSYLQQFPFDILKIDRCFVSNISIDRKNTAIVKALIQMAHQLNLTVIAEGVETHVELDFLRRQQCDAIQGYLFSRPLPVAEFEKLLTSGNRLKLS